VVQVYEENVGGLKLADVMEVADRVLIFHKNRVYRYTRDLIKKYQKTHFLLAISLSPYHIVEPFARYWGFNKVYALFYEVDDQGMFTGSVDHKDLMMRKDKVLKRAVEKENLTLQGSIGVGDTESDATFLELVQRPIAFNPNSTLHEIAKRRGWEIVVERKDVVYNMNEHLKL
jgi:phosphoserine phosphatase